MTQERDNRQDYSASSSGISADSDPHTPQTHYFDTSKFSPNFS